MSTRVKSLIFVLHSGVDLKKGFEYKLTRDLLRLGSVVSDNLSSKGAELSDKSTVI